MKFERLTAPVPTKYEDVFVRPNFCMPKEGGDMSVAKVIWTDGLCDADGKPLEMEGMPEEMGDTEAIHIIRMYSEAILSAGKPGTA